MSSYKVKGNWHTHEEFQGVELQVCDLIESEQRVWSEGAWRVRGAGLRTRTFKGESAWSDARRWFGDVTYRRQLEA